jgi:protein SCO1/2
MARPPVDAVPPNRASRLLDGGFWIVIALTAVLVVGVFGSLALGTPGGGSGAAAGSGAGGSVAGDASASAGPSGDLVSYLYVTPRPAPAILLTDASDASFSLASLRGEPAFVFFGYTHCPDVCPATVGTVGLAMEASAPGSNAVFVSIDPERDTTTWLREYVRFLPRGFTAVTGPADRVRATADAWGVRYARVETGQADGYSMSHTADVYLVDAAGMLRAHFPFGTSSEVMAAVLRLVTMAPGSSEAGGTPTLAASPSPSPAPRASPVPTVLATPTSSTGLATTAPGASSALGVEVTSSSVWAGAAGPVIMTLSIDGSRLDDTALAPELQLVATTGELVGSPVAAIAVRPPGLATVSYVGTLPIPAPGAWGLTVTAEVDGQRHTGSVALDALDPGTTPVIGGPAPTVRTPTLADVGGVARAVTTDPAPDLRLSRVSTVDALASHQPFVLVIDSTRFRVSPACGRAIIMARYLLDRWPDMAFIHLEPYRYSVVADTAVLEGSLDAPTLTAPAAAWGIGGSPWGPRSMPWVFVVDGQGIVRATYQGVLGTGDVDVMLALIAQGD